MRDTVFAKVLAKFVVDELRPVVRANVHKPVAGKALRRNALLVNHCQHAVSVLLRPEKTFSALCCTDK